MNDNLDARTTQFRMDAALDALDNWADTATDAARAALYEALFAVVDGTVERAYQVVDDERRLNEFSVVVHPELVVKIRVNSFNSFEVVYVGPAMTVSA
jgi:hypothetical protein